MFTHIVIGSNNLTAAKAFYDATLLPLGIVAGRQTGARLFYVGNGLAFGIAMPWDGGVATHGNGGTIGFAAQTPDDVEAFYQAGLAAGGHCEGAPGHRDSAFGPVHAAYLRDLDGNKICAIYRTFRENRST